MNFKDQVKKDLKRLQLILEETKDLYVVKKIEIETPKVNEQSKKAETVNLWDSAVGGDLEEPSGGNVVDDDDDWIVWDSTETDAQDKTDPGVDASRDLDFFTVPEVDAPPPGVDLNEYGTARAKTGSGDVIKGISLEDADDLYGDIMPGNPEDANLELSDDVNLGLGDDVIQKTSVGVTQKGSDDTEDIYDDMIQGSSDDVNQKQSDDITQKGSNDVILCDEGTQNESSGKNKTRPENRKRGVDSEPQIKPCQVVLEQLHPPELKGGKSQKMSEGLTGQEYDEYENDLLGSPVPSPAGELEDENELLGNVPRNGAGDQRDDKAAAEQDIHETKEASKRGISKEVKTVREKKRKDNRSTQGKISEMSPPAAKRIKIQSAQSIASGILSGLGVASYTDDGETGTGMLAFSPG